MHTYTLYCQYSQNWGVIGRQWKLVPREQPESLEYEYSKFATSELITKLEAAGGTQPEISNDDLPKDNEETTSSDLVEFHVEYDNVESKDQSGVGSGCRSYDQYCLDQYCFRLGQLSIMCCYGYHSLLYR